MQTDWENLAKRLIGASQIGLRIEQDSGHRWIFADENADFLPDCFKEANIDKTLRTKVYGSYQSALDAIDTALKQNNLSSLLEEFDGINHFDDLGVIFGEGTQ